MKCISLLERGIKRGFYTFLFDTTLTCSAESRKSRLNAFGWTNKEGLRENTPYSNYFY
jgi:hypothetical protein